MGSLLTQLLSLLAAVTLAASVANAGDGPQPVADEIFGQVKKGCGNDETPAAYDLNVIAKTYFEAGLAAKLAKSQEDLSLEFDPLVDGQDCKIKDIKTSVVAETNTAATVRATFKNFKESRIVDLVMSRASDGHWQVDDITYGHREFSLRKELK